MNRIEQDFPVLMPVVNEQPLAPLQAQQWNDEEADRVFVGGGPVGLLTAVLTKIQNNGLKIVVLEKRERYERTQTLGIDLDSFHGMPDDEELAEFVAEIRDSRRGLSGPAFVPIQEIERQLKEIALRKGIHILIEEVQDPAALPDRFRHATVFIGADGRNSVVREQIFENEYAFNELISTQAHVTYLMNGAARTMLTATPILGWQAGSLRTAKAMKIATLVEDRISNTENPDQSKASLLFDIPYASYITMNHRPHYGRLERSENAQWNIVPQDLRDDIDLWLGVKRRYHREDSLPETMKLTTVKLEAYAARVFVKMVDEKRYCLIGDAGAGFPYRQGFNFGIVSAIHLAKALTGRIAFDEFQEETANLAIKKLQIAKQFGGLVATLKYWIHATPLVFAFPFSSAEKENFRSSVRQEVPALQN